MKTDPKIDPKAGPAEIAERQFPLVKQHLGFIAASSPFYRAKFAEIGFSVDDFNSLEDLARLPLTGKQDLTLSNEAFLAVPEEQVVDICQTSGTTGEPVAFWQTESDLRRLATNEYLAFTTAGITRHDRVLIGAALDRAFMAGLAYFLGLRKIGATVIRSGSGQLMLVAEFIRRYRPNVLVGVPSLFLALGRMLRNSGRDPVDFGVDKLICIGEPVRNQNLTLSLLGEELASTWGARVLGTYASTEMATSFCECAAGQGGHLPPQLMAIEIVDEQGRPAAAGTAGEVVATPLGITGTPLLRYRTGDIASLHCEPCSCGRNTPRLGPILGRRAQMLKCRGTTLFPAAIGGALMTLPEVQGHYLEVYREYDLSDRLRVVVGSRGELSAARVAEVIAARTRVKPEVVMVTPEEVQARTIRPDQRKPVTFFDYRQGDPDKEKS